MSIRTAVFVTLGLGVGFTSASAQNADDIFRLFGGMMQTAIVQATLDQWRKLPEGEVACVDQNLRQQGSSLQRAIQQGITPSDPRIASSRAACRNQIVKQPMWQGPSFDCSKAKMPDERAICSDPELSKLDNLVAGGYNYLRSRYGVQFAESVGAPLWRARQACGSDVTCIKQKQIAAIEEYKARGALIAAPDSNTTRGVDKSIYIVDGVSLGSRVVFDSPAYREYQCTPSEQFAGFTWCQKKRQEKDARGQYASTYSILHSGDGVALYINRYLEPAWFSGDEANNDINSRSKRLGAPSQIIPMPTQSSVPHGMIVTWGNVALEPLDSDHMRQLAAGHDIQVGFIIDHIGNLQRSAQQGMPIYRLTGGAGYVWAASWNQSGVGTLRFLTIDASAIASRTTVTTTNVEPKKDPIPPAEQHPAPAAEPETTAKKPAPLDEAKLCQQLKGSKTYFVAFCVVRGMEQSRQLQGLQEAKAEVEQAKAGLVCTPDALDILQKLSDRSAAKILGSGAISKLMDFSDAMTLECKKAANVNF